MTNKQWFIIAILGFVLLLIVSIGGYAYAITNNISDILQSPASTSKFDIDADVMMTMSNKSGLQVEYIHLHRIQGEINSKILDFILLAIKK